MRRTLYTKTLMQSTSIVYFCLYFSLRPVCWPTPTPVAECGTTLQRQSAQRRIVGGDEAGFGTFPWQVRQHTFLFFLPFSRCSSHLKKKTDIGSF